MEPLTSSFCVCRHGLGDKGTSSSSSTSAFESKPSYNGRLSDNRYSRESRDREIVSATPTGSWRRRHDSITSNNASDLYSPPTPSSPAVVHQPPKWEIPDQHITARKTVISRSTSPVLDSRKGLRTRIARTTDPIVVEQRRSRKPRVIDAECQTETIPEFGTLEDYLHPPPPPEVKEEPNEVWTVILLVRQDAKDRLSNMSFRMALSKKKAQLLIHTL